MKGNLRWTSGACALALVMVVMSGCASAPGYAPGTRYAEAATHAAARAARSVVVLNHSWDRVTVYLLNEAGAKTRLGDVEAMEKASFAVGQVNDDGAGMYFMAHPLAGTDFASEGFLFPSGSTAVWTIENHAALSSVSVH